MKDKILICGTNRCGTTYLYYLLQNYLELNDSKCLNEPFKDAISTRNISDFLDTMSTLHSAELIKEHAQTFRVYEYETGNDLFEFYKDFYRIRVIRQNRAEAIISMAIAETTNKYHRTILDTSDSVIIDLEHLDRVIDKINYGYDSILMIPEDWFDETVYYEDLSLDPNKDQQLIKYITQHKDIKINTIPNKDKRSVIKNYDEVLDIVKARLYE